MFGSTPGTVLISYGIFLVALSVIISLTCKKMFQIDPEEDAR